MDRMAFVDRIAQGMTLYLHGRWGGVWEARTLAVVSVVDAERELAHMAREWDQVEAVLMDHGERVAEWGRP